jgi:hypothetical protein
MTTQKGFRPKHMVIVLAVVAVVIIIYYLLKNKSSQGLSSPAPVPHGNPTVTFDPNVDNGTDPTLSWDNTIKTQNDGASIRMGDSSYNSLVTLVQGSPGALDLSSLSYNSMPRNNVALDFPGGTVYPGGTPVSGVTPVSGFPTGASGGGSDGCGCGGACQTTCNNGCGTIGGRSVYSQGCNTTKRDLIRNQPSGYWQNYTGNVISGVNPNQIYDVPRLNSNGTQTDLERPTLTNGSNDVPRPRTNTFFLQSAPILTGDSGDLARPIGALPDVARPNLSSDMPRPGMSYADLDRPY